MKLNNRQVAEIETQVGFRPIPDGAPALSTLQEHFGDRTFYVDGDGLHIWQRVERPANAVGQPLRLVCLASWADEEKTTLAPHEPEPSDLVVEVTPEDDPDSAA